MANQQEHLPLTEAVYYILLALQTPLHGYGIMQFVKEVSNERVTLGPGTLYGAIKNMQDKGWIQLVHTDTRKKEYMITDLGMETLYLEMDRLEELFNNGKKILGGRS